MPTTDALGHADTHMHVPRAKAQVPQVPIGSLVKRRATQPIGNMNNFCRYPSSDSGCSLRMP